VSTGSSALVIGGGIVALCCAVRLQDKGFSVVMAHGEDAAPSPSLGNAGHLAVEQTEPLASRKTILGAVKNYYPLGGALDMPLRETGAWSGFALRFLAASAPERFAAGKAALERWLGAATPAWRRLCAGLEADDLLSVDGHFVVWESEGSAARGRERWRAVGSPTSEFRDATGEELAALRGMIRTPIADAIRFLHSGQIHDLGAIRMRLIERFAAAGGERVALDAAEIACANGAAEVRLADGSTRRPDLVLVAAGVASGRLLRGVGHRAPVIAERGYHIDAPSAEWPERFPPVVFEDRSMIVSRYAASLRAASYVEFTREGAPPDRSKWARLKRNAAEIGLPLDPPVTEWLGARPTLPDYLPAVGRSLRAGNLYYAFGHQHLGLTLAPSTAEVIADLAAGERPLLDTTPFDLARFEGARPQHSREKETVR